MMHTIPYDMGPSLRMFGPLGYGIGRPGCDGIQAGHVYAIYDSPQRGHYDLQDETEYADFAVTKTVAKKALHIISFDAHQAWWGLYRSKDTSDQALARALQDAMLAQSTRPIPREPRLIAITTVKSHAVWPKFGGIFSDSLSARIYSARRSVRHGIAPTDTPPEFAEPRHARSGPASAGTRTPDKSVRPPKSSIGHRVQGASIVRTANSGLSWPNNVRRNITTTKPS